MLLYLYKFYIIYIYKKINIKFKVCFIIRNNDGIKPI